MQKQQVSGSRSGGFIGNLEHIKRFVYIFIVDFDYVTAQRF